MKDAYFSVSCNSGYQETVSLSYQGTSVKHMFLSLWVFFFLHLSEIRTRERQSFPIGKASGRRDKEGVDIIQQESHTQGPPG